MDIAASHARLGIIVHCEVGFYTLHTLYTS